MTFADELRGLPTWTLIKAWEQLAIVTWRAPQESSYWIYSTLGAVLDELAYRSVKGFEQLSGGWDEDA